MRKSNLKILSLCIMVAGVFALHNGVDAANVCTSSKLGHMTQFAACSAASCKHASGLNKCKTYCPTDEEIQATHPNCATAAVKAGLIKAAEENSDETGDDDQD